MGCRKITTAFDGGQLSSGAGVMLLAAAVRRMGIAERLVIPILDRRDPTRVVHPLCQILRARILATACIRGAARGRFFNTVDLVNRIEAESR